jgi:hypothetical protein
MSGRFEGKVAVVTGAAAGFGLADWAADNPDDPERAFSEVSATVPLYGLYGTAAEVSNLVIMEGSGTPAPWPGTLRRRRVRRIRRVPRIVGRRCRAAHGTGP